MEPSKAIQTLLLLEKEPAYQQREWLLLDKQSIIFLMYSSWLSLKALYFVLIISSMKNAQPPKLRYGNNKKNTAAQKRNNLIHHR